MMHNPFQSYQNDPTLAAYAGLANPQFGQTGYVGIPNYGNIHPQQLQLASLLTSQGGIPQTLGQSPVWQQNPYAGVQNPWTTGGLQNLAPNPFTGQQQFGPQVGQPFQHPLYQAIGQGSPYGQQGSPFSQFGSPFPQHPWQQQTPQPYSPYQQTGQGLPFAQSGLPFAQYGQPYGQTGLPLAPQSWVGQAGPFGGAQPFSQIHPLLAQQLAARILHAQGFSPWTGF